jgi:predicted O-methyltransferase YrrM
MNELQRAVLRIQLWPIRRYREIEGWLSDREAQILYRTARRLPAASRVLEIGSWKGKSTYCIASGLRDGIIYALDPFDGSDVPKHLAGAMPLLDQFKHNLGRGLMERVEIKRGRSADFAGTFQNLDFVFIDGDHSIAACRYDYETYGPAVKQGGWLAFHDYRPNQELGAAWVVDQLVKPSGEWEWQGNFDSVALFRRTAPATRH